MFAQFNISACQQAHLAHSVWQPLLKFVWTNTELPFISLTRQLITIRLRHLATQHCTVWKQLEFSTLNVYGCNSAMYFQWLSLELLLCLGFFFVVVVLVVFVCLKSHSAPLTRSCKENGWKIWDNWDVYQVFTPAFRAVSPLLLIIWMALKGGCFWFRPQMECSVDASFPLGLYCRLL